MGFISSLFVRKVVTVANDRVDKPAMMRRYGVDPDNMPDMSVMIPAAEYYALLEELAGYDAEDEAFNLRASASMICEDYGAFGLAWKSALTLRGSFERAERYARLLTSVSTYELREDGEDVILVHHREGNTPPGLLLSNEATIGSIQTICQEVSPSGFHPKTVFFRHAATKPVSLFEAFFQCPVHFGAEFNGLRITRDQLNASNRLGDEAMSRYFTQLLEGEIERIEEEETLEHQVRLEVSQALSAGVPKMTDVARQLGMSERTLHRRLSDHGVSYQTLVEKSRQELAYGLLHQTGYSLAEVAFLTGFSEQSAFNRAFKRWAGQTPAAFRKQAVLAPPA